MFQLTLHPRKIALFFLTIVISLTVLHSVVQAIFLSTMNENLLELSEFVDLDIEKNLPSLYSAFGIFFSSFLLFCTALLEKNKGGKRRYWFGLAAIFLFLAFDEAFALHEGLGDYTEKYIKSIGKTKHVSGLLYFPWIIPYSILTAILGLFYFRFIFRLPKKTMVLLICSAVIFLTGAGFFDMLGGKEAELHGYYSNRYVVLYTVEEFLEMSGIVLLMYTLLDYIEQQYGHLCFSLEVRQP